MLDRNCKMDNPSAHKNDTIRDLVNKHNKLLYSEFFTNILVMRLRIN